MNVLVVRGFPNPHLQRARSSENGWQGSDPNPHNTVPKPQITEEDLIFTDHQKTEPPNPTVPKAAETKQPIQVPHAVRTGGQRRGGMRRGLVPSPIAFPWREGRTRARRSLGSPRSWTCRAHHPGPRVLLGASTLSRAPLLQPPVPKSCGNNTSRCSDQGSGGGGGACVFQVLMSRMSCTRC